jgi:hypothetical protein
VLASCWLLVDELLLEEAGAWLADWLLLELPEVVGLEELELELEGFCAAELEFELDEPVLGLELPLGLELDFFGAEAACFGFGAGVGVV